MKTKEEQSCTKAAQDTQQAAYLVYYCSWKSRDTNPEYINTIPTVFVLVDIKPRGVDEPTIQNLDQRGASAVRPGFTTTKTQSRKDRPSQSTEDNHKVMSRRNRQKLIKN